MIGDWVRGDTPQAWDHLKGLRIGVLGYGNQGRAQALNLRDSGRDHQFTVLVGARPGGEGARVAGDDGFEVISMQACVQRCRILISLLPDEHQAEILSRQVFAPPDRREAPAAGDAGSQDRTAQILNPPLLCLAHGFSLLYGGLEPPPDWDVVLVAPTGPGSRLREAFIEGRGLPGIVAVHQDAGGSAEERALALAQGLGLLRQGVYITTVENETVVDLFGEQAVLCGGMMALAQAAYDTLVKAGYPGELAYIECMQQVGVTADLLTRFGPEGMREKISPTALFGELTRGPRIINDQVRERLAEILNEAASGRFGKEWMEDVAHGNPRLDDLLKQARHHPSNAMYQKLARWRGDFKNECMSDDLRTGEGQHVPPEAPEKRC
ncbi:MAG: ketol-acid reductoisomerase [Candidatus Eisenbacteria bacterium]|uniref:Ketol-acid reductoisomerase n=1 Tax=Eiseniibacteriota bacterium TaxID=2212470 RepID=A0A948W510_UNCEI|nr:ketol-acid reductoisomerase [Candidatus Eisenbacteria bacterium]MBU1947790.1 ketol-acid reductoisomerase [Candidatus Eisenbacteria bacterium]MBU2689545.1 ketol-acid reductoisomerase [Candidatus Eisenbacteria bacterium]